MLKNDLHVLDTAIALPFVPQLYLCWYTSQGFSGLVIKTLNCFSAGFGSTGCVVNNKNFSQEISFDEVFQKRLRPTILMSLFCCESY